MEQQQHRRKISMDGNENPSGASHTSSGEVLRSPARSLSHVPEEEDGTFAVGDDDSDDEETVRQVMPTRSSPSVEASYTPSLASPVDESVPHQLRGLSEKARGKMPAGQTVFSRQNSTTSLSSYIATPSLQINSNGFVPTAAWVSINSAYIKRILLTSPFRLSRGFQNSPFIPSSL